MSPSTVLDDEHKHEHLCFNNNEKIKDISSFSGFLWCFPFSLGRDAIKSIGNGNHYTFNFALLFLKW